MTDPVHLHDVQDVPALMLALGCSARRAARAVAEMSSAFCCATLGIVPTVRHADYIGSWLEVLREDNRAIVRAASAASKAADYLLAFRPEDGPSADTAALADEREAAWWPPLPSSAETESHASASPVLRLCASGE